jgi:hypothetical protein
MKKTIKALVLVLLISVTAISFSGCYSHTYASKQEGTYVGDTFELSVPDGWMKNERYENQVIFCTKDYPDDCASYISVGYSDEGQLDVLKKYEDSIKEEMISYLEEQLGDDCEATIYTYEDTTVNGYECVHIVSSYKSDNVVYTQDQYTFDSSTGSVVFCYTRAGADDLAEAYQESIDSIVIK